LAARAAAGESDQALAEDRAQYQAGLIGAVLPRFVNDWVVYLPDDATRTILLIPQPPAAGLGFWLNKPAPAYRSADPPRRESRLTRYRRLAAMVPVIAVFPNAATAAPYTAILAAGGFEWATVGGIGARLTRVGAGVVVAGKGVLQARFCVGVLAGVAEGRGGAGLGEDHAVGIVGGCADDAAGAVGQGADAAQLVGGDSVGQVQSDLFAGKQISP